MSRGGMDLDSKYFLIEDYIKSKEGKDDENKNGEGGTDGNKKGEEGRIDGKKDEIGMTVQRRKAEKEIGEFKFDKLEKVLEFLKTSKKSFADYVKELRNDSEYRNESMARSSFRFALFKRIGNDAGVDVSDFTFDELRYLSVNYDPYKKLCAEVLSISVEYKRAS